MATPSSVERYQSKVETPTLVLSFFIMFKKPNIKIEISEGDISHEKLIYDSDREIVEKIGFENELIKEFNILRNIGKMPFETFQEYLEAKKKFYIDRGFRVIEKSKHFFAVKSK